MASDSDSDSDSGHDYIDYATDLDEESQNLYDGACRIIKSHKLYGWNRDHQFLLPGGRHMTATTFPIKLQQMLRTHIDRINGGDEKPELTETTFRDLADNVLDDVWGQYQNAKKIKDDGPIPPEMLEPVPSRRNTRPNATVPTNVQEAATQPTAPTHTPTPPEQPSPAGPIEVQSDPFTIVQSAKSAPVIEPECSSRGNDAPDEIHSAVPQHISTETAGDTQTGPETGVESSRSGGGDNVPSDIPSEARQYTSTEVATEAQAGPETGVESSRNGGGDDALGDMPSAVPHHTSTEATTEAYAGRETGGELSRSGDDNAPGDIPSAAPHHTSTEVATEAQVGRETDAELSSKRSVDTLGEVPSAAAPHISTELARDVQTSPAMEVAGALDTPDVDEHLGNSHDPDVSESYEHAATKIFSQREAVPHTVGPELLQRDFAPNKGPASASTPATLSDVPKQSTANAPATSFANSGDATAQANANNSRPAIGASSETRQILDRPDMDKRSSPPPADTAEKLQADTNLHASRKSHQTSTAMKPAQQNALSAISSGSDSAESRRLKLGADVTSDVPSQVRQQAPSEATHTPSTSAAAAPRSSTTANSEFATLLKRAAVDDAAAKNIVLQTRFVFLTEAGLRSMTAEQRLNEVIDNTSKMAREDVAPLEPASTYFQRAVNELWIILQAESKAGNDASNQPGVSGPAGASESARMPTLSTRTSTVEAGSNGPREPWEQVDYLIELAKTSLLEDRQGIPESAIQVESIEGPIAMTWTTYLINSLRAVIREEPSPADDEPSDQYVQRKKQEAIQRAMQNRQEAASEGTALPILGNLNTMTYNARLIPRKVMLDVKNPEPGNCDGLYSDWYVRKLRDKLQELPDGNPVFICEEGGTPYRMFRHHIMEKCLRLNLKHRRMGERDGETSEQTTARILKEVIEKYDPWKGFTGKPITFDQVLPPGYLPTRPYKIHDVMASDTHARDLEQIAEKSFFDDLIAYHFIDSTSAPFDADQELLGQMHYYRHNNPGHPTPSLQWAAKIVSEITGVHTEPLDVAIGSRYQSSSLGRNTAPKHEPKVVQADKAPARTQKQAATHDKPTRERQRRAEGIDSSIESASTRTETETKGRPTDRQQSTSSLTGNGPTPLNTKSSGKDKEAGRAKDAEDRMTKQLDGELEVITMDMLDID